MPSAVEIQNVTKSFGPTVAVNDLSLTVPTGSVYGFIGPNGSGKTTTLRMIMRIFHPDSGRPACSAKTRRMPPHRTGSVICRRSEVSIARWSSATFCDSLRNLKGTRPRRPRSTVGWRGWGWKAMGRRRVETLSKGHVTEGAVHRDGAAPTGAVDPDEPFSGLDPVNMDLLRRRSGIATSRGDSDLFDARHGRRGEECAISYS